MVERHEPHVDLKAAADAEMSAASVPVLRADGPGQESDDSGGYARHENGVEHDHVGASFQGGVGLRDHHPPVRAPLNSHPRVGPKPPWIGVRAAWAFGPHASGSGYKQ